MSDWAQIAIPDFDEMAVSDDRISVLVGRLILERLPFACENKAQYLTWKDRLAQGIGVDACDIYLIGSACTGRSLNPRNHFNTFKPGSDLDIAIVSPHRFDEAWQWFRTTNPNFLGLDTERKDLFDRHRDWNIFHGYVTSEYFLCYFSFGNDWLTHLQLCEELLPKTLRGRAASIRIYRDASSLRRHQTESLRLFRKYKGIET
jgi:hypothetical protein